MDYLRNLGSAAVSSLVQKSGLNLPFTLGQRITSFDGRTIWNLYEATKRDDSSLVSVFEFDGAQKNLLPLAKNALRKLRTVRHPDVLKFIDVVETDTTIHIMTERVHPLHSALQKWAGKGEKEKEDWLIWGLHRVSVAVSFVNDTAASTHGNVCTDSIFISPSGEWKLGGLELLSSPNDPSSVLYTMGSILPGSNMHASPEVQKGGWSVLKEHNPAVADAYALGLLLHAVFNPNQGPPATASPPHTPPTASSRGAIPTSVFPSFRRLLHPQPKSRLPVTGFLEIGMAQTGGDGAGFFLHNPLVTVCASLDNFALSSESDKAAFLRTLQGSVGAFPPEFAAYKVLPSLVGALEFGGAAAASIVPLVLQIGRGVGEDDYARVILAPVLKLYASADRGTRMALLDALPDYADKLDKKMVTDKIWPNLQTGFLDTVAVIREATVKSIILLAPKFNDRILNNDLLRHLAKMQSDPEASIRTNACILMGRLAPSLGYHTKQKVLVPAFGKALKDPFVHARVAGLMAFMATAELFSADDLAGKVVPNVAGAMVDKEKLVRDQAFKAIELFVKKLEEHAATMPETALPADGSPLPNGTSAPATPGGSTLVNSAAGAAGALAGWAFNSLGKKLATADLQTAIAGSTLDRPTSAPAPSIPVPPPLTSTLSSPNTSAHGKARGMQLGASKAPTTSALAAEWAEEAEAASVGNAWGTDDLMDVNADEGDWTAFESAPVPIRGLGFDDAWDDMASTAPPPRKTPIAAPVPHRPAVQSKLATPAPTSKPSTPVPSAPATPASAASPPPASTAGMSKEEKAAEMARRKEERRLRIEKLKEQKKAGGPKP